MISTSTEPPPNGCRPAVNKAFAVVVVVVVVVDRS